jgi:Protein of unknown function (DUF2934)
MILPINAQELEDKIRKRAYEIHIQHHGGSGSDIGDWLQAEQEIIADRELTIDEASEESFPASDPPAF